LQRCILAKEDSRGYRFLEHMTDAEIEAYGSTLEEGFENAAKALEDTMVDVGTIRQQIKDRIKVDGLDKKELLYQWLEALIIKQDTEGMLYSKFDCKISEKTEGEKGFTLEATASGEKFDPKIHEERTAIKAPTYHEMSIIEDGRRVTLRFLIDL
jgi:SHS2 domain-containing protein